LDNAGISALIPPKRYGHQHDSIWGRKHFRWLPEEDAFLCPAGQGLRRLTNVTTTRRIGYRAPKGGCADCRFRPHCAPSGRERTVHRFWEKDLVEVARAAADEVQRQTEGADSALADGSSDEP
jgi:hypothetical protein